MRGAGEIDLLIRTNIADPLALEKARRALVIDLYDAIGEQRLDVRSERGGPADG
jgi:hypothetical protein